MHIIRAFTHLQVRKIPEKYIRKRYTRDARQEVPWDRHDGVRIGPAASQEQTRMSKLLPKLMKLGRAGSRSDRACQETDRQLDKIIPGIEMFTRSTGSGSPGDGQSAAESVARTADDETTADGSPGSGPSATGSVVTATQPDNGTTGSQPSSMLLNDGLLLIEPPMSRTKGRAPGKKRKNENEPPCEGNLFSTYDRENYGNKECSGCGVRGSHYITTCPINPSRSRAAEKRLSSEKSAKPHDGPPRKRGRPKIVRDLHEENDVHVAKVDQTQPSSSARGRTSSATISRGSRGRGQPCVNRHE
jgi:hypothetical protein